MSSQKMDENVTPEQHAQSGRVVQVVGNYLVGPTIGKGFFAKVKRVEDPYRQVYAMKCFDKERIGKSTHSLRQVEKEINALRLCHHSNIAGFHEVLEVENSVYLVMEFVPRGELFDYIKNNGRLCESEAAHMARQLLLALGYCHRLGIAHRDVKPENVLVDEAGNVKLADFGLCSFFASADATGGDGVGLVSADPDADPFGTARDPLLHTQCGSPHYAAPEVLIGVGYQGPSADVWSFGVLLYAMVTGSLPFTARVIPQLVQKIVSGVYRMPVFLSPLLKHLISGILRVNPEDRLTVDEILNHPWFAKTEPWVPEPAAAPLMRTAKPTGKSHMDASVASTLALAARQTSSAESATCSECGGNLAAQVGTNGQIVLGGNRCSCEHQIFSSPAARASPAAMPLPRLFHAPDEGTDIMLSSSAEHVDAALPSGEFWRPPQLDLAKAVASDREFELMTACEKGDLEQVKAILYDSTPCPGVVDILSGKQPKSCHTDQTSSGTRAPQRSAASTLAGFVICGGASAATVHPEDDTPLVPAGAATEDDVTTTADYRLRSCVCPSQQHRLDIRVGGLDKWTALHIAARAGHEAICEELLLSCLPLDINALTKNHWTALMFAADRGHEGVVEVLLKFRADIHTVSIDGKTAIYLARERSHAAISQRLTEAWSVRHLNTLQHHSMVAVHALQTLSAAAAIICKDQPTDSQAQGTDRVPAPLRIARASRTSWFALSGLQGELTEACEQGDVQKIDKLFPFSTQCLEGTDYDARNADKAREVEHGGMHISVPPSLSVPPVSGAQVDFLALGIDNWTLLHFAARRGESSAVGRLLELLLGCVPVADVVSLLNAQTKTGWTALMMAVDKAHVETVKLLVQCGADVTKRSAAGETAHSMAIMYRDDERYQAIIAVLEEALQKSHA